MPAPAAGGSYRLGILPGTFNPPTRAHAALMTAAAGHVDEVLCVIPKVFPHKSYHGASLEDRLAMLERTGTASIAVTDQGLFIDIARECRQEYGAGTELIFLCGRDAAERIVEWKYGEPGAIDRMLEEFSLLVAARHGEYEPPERLAHRVRTLELGGDWNEVSSTEVRARIARGASVDDLVPEAIRDMVVRIYGPDRP